MTGTDDSIKDTLDRMHVLNPFCLIKIQEDADLGTESSSPRTTNFLVSLLWTSWPLDSEIHISLAYKLLSLECFVIATVTEKPTSLVQGTASP